MKREEEDSRFEGKGCYQKLGRKEGSRERKSMACPASLQLGVGEASGQPQCGAFTHGCSVLAQILCSENWESEQGQCGGSYFPCLIFQRQTSGRSGPRSAKLFPLFSLLMPAVLKSPVASLLPDVASRCGLELFQADKGCRDCSQSPGFSSSLVRWGLSNALPPRLPFLD